MILGNDERQLPLFRDLRDERYIFYTGKKAKSKFDIEAVMIYKPSYKVILLVDQKDTIELLCKRIGDTMERFAAFSGIPRLSAKNLQIFSERGITRAPLVGIVGDFIKNGDKVFFELDYQEFWIEVDVSLFCLNKHLKIELSLRIDKNDKIENLKQDIASISICLWNHFVKKQQDFHVYDYFLLKEFEILDFEEKPRESVDLLINNVYDFDSRIKCVCEFININQYISANLAQNVKINYLQKSKLISEYLAKLMCTSDRYLEYVIWKREAEEIEDKSVLIRRSGTSKDNLVYEDEVESQYYPRISTNYSLNKQNSEINLNLYRSCNNLNLSANNLCISSKISPSKKKNQDNELEKLKEILQNFTLNEFINEKSNISIYFKNKDNIFKITKFLDMTGASKVKESISKSVNLKHDFRRLSERKDVLENIRKKRMYVIMIAIVFFVFFYTFIV